MPQNYKKLFLISTVSTLIIVLLILTGYKAKDRYYLNSSNKLTVEKDTESLRKYVYFTTNHGGFNNQLGQIWLYKFIAKLTGRDLVISGFHPQRDEYTYTPLSTYIDEPSFLDGISAISEKEYNSTCRSKSHVIERPEWGIWDPKIDQIRELVNEINSVSNKCLMITGHIPSYIYYWSDFFIRDYPEIKEKSLKNFKLTQKVLDVVKQYKIDNELNKEKYLSVHLRRGDFEEHCKKYLIPGKRGAFSFNQLFGKFPVLIPEDPLMEHCFPSVKTIVKVIDVAISKLPSKPKSIFLMHNANSTELEELLPLLSKRFDRFIN
ncbi:hypothetical protein CONCODRAFT_70034 [Conidiobolus coronatus NRRL 28638]|uniref:Uncharacterized protein n=1 Tax=Conidiobolus coronatus (strain ATCC 28846 / CBS 209.66 / NRRL 28638) TaxID=796925 RepID=A0A137P862_CONC2|nr:hypothetical protein CONCODRAFT_70034 [Conidiobolus coronatus NRRL 28638]|eukprot:KXN71190.1 hypothetical protein CONCODRAFT_70034 [Conidiobolus coronatus NRRL 28638]